MKVKNLIEMILNLADRVPDILEHDVVVEDLNGSREYCDYYEVTHGERKKLILYGYDNAED